MGLAEAVYVDLGLTDEKNNDEATIIHDEDPVIDGSASQKMDVEMRKKVKENEPENLIMIEEKPEETADVQTDGN